MKQKVFISYSHTDEKYMVQLRNHITMLEKEGLIEEWNDRKLIAGQDWDKEISENLASSTVIIMLISSDFLGSKYCFDIEMTRAMELHESRNAIVIPVIVRSCDWARAPFAKIQALPKNALPIKKWLDEDDGWLNVAQGLRKTLLSFSPTFIGGVTSPKEKSKLTTLIISTEFQGWLQDTEVLLTHRKVSKVLLDDIYVQPDMSTLLDEDRDILQSVSALDKILNKGLYFIFGEEQQGKTSLLKQCIKKCYESSLVPIYIYKWNKYKYIRCR